MKSAAARRAGRRVLTALLGLSCAAISGAAVEFTAGESAYVVAVPKTEQERRSTGRLTDYLAKVLGKPPRIVASLEAVPVNEPAVMLAGGGAVSPLGIAAPHVSLESFALETTTSGTHAVVVAVGNSDRGLKRVVQRLILQGEQRVPGWVVPTLHLADSPWIAQCEWTLCPWAPDRVRGVFSNANADTLRDGMGQWLFQAGVAQRFFCGPEIGLFG